MRGRFMFFLCVMLAIILASAGALTLEQCDETAVPPVNIQDFVRRFQEDLEALQGHGPRNDEKDRRH